MKAVDDRGGQMAKRKARMLAAAVGEAFYAVTTLSCFCVDMDRVLLSLTMT